MEQKYVNHLGRKHQILRLLWSICWGLFASWIPRSMASGWKRLLLRIFGAKIASTAVVHSSAKVYYPANLIMDEYACLDARVNCYNVAPIYIGKFATVSQGAFLCTASHNINSPNHELITEPIELCNQSWVGADAYINMGVTIGEGAVVGARAAVFKSVEPWEVVGGNPAKIIKKE